jgi:xylan 1,4-beta-xylosidase
MQYFELYEATVKTVKNIASSLRVGGPSTSNFVPDDRFAGEKEDLDAQKYLAEVSPLTHLSFTDSLLTAILGRGS